MYKKILTCMSLLCVNFVIYSYVSAAPSTSVSITTSSLPTVNAYANYSHSLEAIYDTSFSLNWSISSGKLPTGISLSSLGVLTGTPVHIGTYSIQVTATDGFSADTKTLALVVDSPLKYPSGTLLRKDGENTVWLLENDKLKGFRTPTEFLSHGFSFDSVIVLGTGEFKIYGKQGVVDIQNGSLVKPSNAQTVYLVQGKTLRPFSSADIFLNLRYNWDAIYTMVTEEENNYTIGALMTQSEKHFPYTKIRWQEGNTVYLLVEDGGVLKKQGIPSEGVFLSQGWKWEEIIPVRASEINSYPTLPPLFYRDGSIVTPKSNPTIYVMEYGKKRPLQTADHFRAMRYQWANIITILDTEASAIPTGSVLIPDQGKIDAWLAEKAKQEEAQKQQFASKTVSGSIATSVGTFQYLLVKTTLAGTKVRTVSASKDDCGGSCQAKPLASYVQELGGFAGIHGTYFCPPDYSYCNGAHYAYDSPVWDSLTNRWIWWTKKDWNHRGALVFRDGQNPSSYWPGGNAPQTGINAGIMNFPLLVHNGSIVATWENSDGGQRNKATRAAIGYSDQHIFLVRVSNANIVDTAHVLQALGATSALNLDGGGSTAIYHEGQYVAGPGRLLPNAIVLVKE